MLVLTRKEGEYVQIGDNIRVWVSQVRGCRVRIAIDAPQEMRIQRSEFVAADDSSKQ